jgi:hypothetical protein
LNTSIESGIMMLNKNGSQERLKNVGKSQNLRDADAPNVSLYLPRLKQKPAFKPL